MAYYLNLFTPQTWAAFRENGAKVSGFSKRQSRTAERLSEGDIFCCYLVHLSRWCGILEIESGMFVDDNPIFDDPDPYICRFKVRPIVTLDFEHSIPIYEDEVWNALSITRDIPRRQRGWAQLANLRASLRELPKEDGSVIAKLLDEQKSSQEIFPLSTRDRRKIRGRRSIPTGDRSVVVDIPDEEDDDDDLENVVPEETFRESHQMQALLATMGAKMGFRIWIPAGDRQRILAQVEESTAQAFLSQLPLNYDENTLRTIEQIDVIWLRNRSMARAFEVEHTTAIYSGLLRMADLLALQPNMAINLHIVAPDEKENKVIREIVRPVFSLLDQGPLYESCTFLSYSSIREISEMTHLQHMSDTVLDDYIIAAAD